MKKLLLPLTFLCLFASNTMLAQEATNVNTPLSKKIKKKDCKKAKDNAVITPKKVASKSLVVTIDSNKNAIRKLNHREMIAKRKRIVQNY